MAALQWTPADKMQLVGVVTDPAFHCPSSGRTRWNDIAQLAREGDPRMALLRTHMPAVHSATNHAHLYKMWQRLKAANPEYAQAEEAAADAARAGGAA